MDYTVKPIGAKCAATEIELEPGSTCHSVLVDQDGEILRLDFSEDGWSGPPENSIAHWQCQVPQVDLNKPKPLDTDALMTCFEQLEEDANPGQDKFKYVLALLLLQKKRLRLEGSHFEDEVEYLELTGIHGEGPFRVLDQDLTDQEIAELQQSLNSELLR
ncbi:MAG: hypothetical protein CMJ78_04020 [Planctomycetaceae bacterium]|nr:hypothetical protein [Planctomycetaceae bacterium]